MKRVLALVLCLCMVLTVAPAVAAAETGPVSVYYGDTETYYETLEAALATAEGGTIILHEDVTAGQVVIPKDFILSLNGYTLTADMVIVFNGMIIDNMKSSSKLAVPQDMLKIIGNNGGTLMPVWDNVNNCYIFASAQYQQIMNVAEDLSYANYIFIPNFSGDALALLGDGSADNGISVKVLLSWNNGASQQIYTFSDELVAQVYGSADENGVCAKVFQLTITGFAGIEDMTACAVVESAAGGKIANAESKVALPEPEPEFALTAGQQVVIYAPAYNVALSSAKAGYYNAGVNVTITDGVMTGYGDTEIWTVGANEDGTFTFSQGGQNIGLAASYTSMNLGEVNDAWQVIDLGDGLYNLLNVGREVYMEWYANYNNWSTYGTSDAATNDLFQLSFYVVEEGAGTETPDPTPDPEPEEPTTPSEPEPTEPTTPSEPENNDPAADSVLTIAEAIALGASKEHNTYTEGKYYVTGVIIGFSNTQYGNMYIADEAGNSLLVYGTYSADGQTRYDAMEVKPVVGDTVTVYGIIGQHSGAAQMKNGWVTEHIPGEGEPENNDPAADSTLTVAEAIALGASKLHNIYTEGKYYVTGVITEVYGTEYGNMRITDDAGNILTVYGTYSADGQTRYDAMEVQPVAGDTITVYGIIGQYNGTPQMKSGWLIEHIPAGGGTTEPEPEEPTVPSEPEPEPEEPSTPSEPVNPEPEEPVVTVESFAMSDYIVDGQQGGAECSRELGDKVVFTISSGWFTTQARIYKNANGVIASTADITSLTLNIGGKDSTFNVYTSEDGETWTEYQMDVAYTTAYSDVTIDFANPVKYIKLDAPNAQIRLQNMSITFGGGSTVEPEEPTVPSEPVEPEPTEPTTPSEPEPEEPADPDPAETTVSKTVAELITEYGWTSTTTKQSFTLDDVVSVKINGGSNTGKAYEGNQIRIYATDTPAGTITISVPEGYELVSITITTQTGTYAFLCLDGTTEDISNTTVAVSGTSVVLNSVKNGSNGKQVRVTAIEVTYK